LAPPEEARTLLPPPLAAGEAAGEEAGEEADEGEAATAAADEEGEAAAAAGEGDEEGAVAPVLVMVMIGAEA
jgi:hypothetical protein